MECLRIIKNIYDASFTICTWLSNNVQEFSVENYKYVLPILKMIGQNTKSMKNGNNSSLMMMVRGQCM